MKRYKEAYSIMLSNPKKVPKDVKIDIEVHFSVKRCVLEDWYAKGELCSKQNDRCPK